MGPGLDDIDAAEEAVLLAELRRRSLRDYVEACYPTITLSPWQIELCEVLQAWVEAIERGESPRLMVHVPPQHGKSTLVSRALPAWIAGRHPEWPGILASYAGSLAAGHGRWIRNQLRSPLHGDTFPHSKLADDSQAKDSMSLVEFGEDGSEQDAGQILSRGVGGATTGQPAMWAIIDDPFSSRAEADSRTIRDNVDDWYTSVATTRLGPGAGVLIMHTRWHIDDLAGRLLKRAKDGADDPHVDQWQVVEYPAQWTAGAPRHLYVFEEDGTGWLRGRYRIGDLKRKRANLPPRDWLSLYQQTPQFDGGGTIKVQWIHEAPWPKGWRPKVYQAWDLAGTAKDVREDACESVGVAVAQDWLHRWWLVDVVRGRWDAGGVVEQILAFARKWKAQRVWGEDPVALWLEPFLVERQRDSGQHIPFVRKSVQGRGDKVARVVGSLIPVMSNGSFYCPSGAAWLPQVKLDLGQFPQAGLDLADALSLLFAEAMGVAQISPPPPVHRGAGNDGLTWDDLAAPTAPTSRRSPWTR